MDQLNNLYKCTCLPRMAHVYMLGCPSLYCINMINFPFFNQKLMARPCVKCLFLSHAQHVPVVPANTTEPPDMLRCSHIRKENTIKLQVLTLVTKRLKYINVEFYNL